MQAIARLAAGRFHYAWIVVGVTFLALLTAAGVRATPSILIVPLQETFGWSRATISAAIALNIALYGFMGPFAAALMQRIGVRRSVFIALVLTAASVALSSFMTTAWQFALTWGLMVGLGTGVVAMVLGATIVSRWFEKSRGLAMGLLAASTASGQLVFLPMLAAVASSIGWRPVTWVVGGALLLILPLFAWLVPERPSAVGLDPYGASAGEGHASAASNRNPVTVAFATLGRAGRQRDFWLLAGSFFVCGFSTNGLIGTHLIPACMDAGIAEVQAAGLLAVMGIFDIVGTTGSGWLSDRFDNRWLLFMYYGLRGLSLIYLPFSDYSFYGLSIFAVFYGLDWLATVPPTLRLTTDTFGRDDAPVVFGWILTAHQIGAATAAYGAGFMRTELDTYLQAFVISGFTCVGAAFLVLLIGRRRHAGGRLIEAASGA